MSPSEAKVEVAIGRAREAYEGLPETTCDHRAICCKAGCPNMYYSEFLSIYQGSFLKMPADKKLEVTIECIRRYLQPQIVEKPKPCVFLGENNMCQVYDHRPLKCRLYGLIPKTLYDWVVEALVADTGVEKEKHPLCTQCDRVKIKPEFKEKFPDGIVPEAMIKSLETRLRGVDSWLGMPAKVQEQGYGFLTYHDWHIMFVCGETIMVALTQLRLKNEPDKNEHFIGVLRDVLKKSYENHE
jgi:Fe-S-cluster containining protein